MKTLWRLTAFCALTLWPASVPALTPFVIETADGSANNTGGFSSIALDSQGNPHVSYWDATTGDLKYAQKSGGTWTTEIADGSANDVGQYTSLALDAQGNPHVSYFDFTAGDLKYVQKSGGVWTIETPDGSGSTVGYFASLALDASGNPHVSYHDFTAGDLKYARKSGGVWTTETVDGSANIVGYYTSLALDASGSPHVSYLDADANDLLYARKSGGVWTIETADGSANFVGFFTSLALDASGNPHVSYYDASTTDLKYARRSGAVWTLETADESANFVGSYSSLALDASGNPHVSYQDVTAGNLKFARKSGGVWTRETAEASANFVGSPTSLALDATGNPHVSHQDVTSNDLKYTYIPSLIVGSPGGGTAWAVGSSQTISWTYTGGLGSDISDVFLSVDGGGNFALLEDDVRDFSVSIRVPHLPTRFARIKVVQSSPFMVGRSDSFFTIDATITLAKFDATRDVGGDGTRLSWETQPGPEADIRYRIERSAAGAAFSSIADGIDRSEFIDPAPAASSRYRLIAINGLGEEYVLGETSAAPALASGRLLTITPNVSAGEATRVVFRANSDFLDTRVSIYDASGRTVKTLAGGVMAPGVQSVTWDGRDESGQQVAPGAYFARLSWGGTPRATERITIVR